MAPKSWWTSLSNKLIDGAYKAANAGQDTRLAMNNTINDSLARIWKHSSGIMGDRQAALNALTKKVLAEAGDLPSEEYDALYDNLEEGRMNYIFGSN